MHNRPGTCSGGCACLRCWVSENDVEDGFLMAGPVQLYDSTLRDGSQMEGISFSLEDKLLIAQKLDELGVDYIEGGFPGSNPKDAEFFVRARDLELRHAR